MGSLEGMQDQQKIAEGYARSILDELDYVGVLTLELFEGNDQLLVNEIAPRVHNSGHWTIEGAQCSQFENHLRAILGDPLGSPEAIGASVMVNCLGVMPNPEALNSLPDTYLHDYGKDLRPNRKVGHVTITATDNRVVEEQLLELRKIAPEIFLGLGASTHRSSGV
jgi:5-(carboxyamino)imidazole ribonucleotide synthase